MVVADRFRDSCVSLGRQWRSHATPFAPPLGQSGFTLIELLVVVGVLGVVGAVAVLNVGQFLSGGQEEAYLAEMHNVQTAVTGYQEEGNVIASEFIVGPGGKGPLEDYLTGTLRYFWLVMLGGAVVPLDVSGGAPGIWGFSEGDGSSAVNGGGLGGTLFGGSWVDGLVGNAIDFGGYDEHFHVPDDPSLDLSTQGTIQAWINPDAYAPYAGIIHKGEDRDFSDEAYTLQFWGHNGTLRFALFNDAGDYMVVDSPAPPPLGQWTHVAATFDQDTVTLYVNGEPVTTRPNSIGVVRNTDGGLQIGSQLTEDYNRGYGHFGFDGKIDEAGVSDTVLTPDDIRELYELNKPA